MASKILKASAFPQDMPIYTDDANGSAGQALLDIVGCGDMRFATLMQKFWAFIAAITPDDENRSLTASEEYIQKAENFIKINAHKKITVNDIAQYIGIDRSYLTRLFRQNLGTSPQQYIMDLKMNIAAQYLKNTGITIKETAQSIGYSDTHVFNKAFKKKFNSSPSCWRQKP